MWIKRMVIFIMITFKMWDYLMVMVIKNKNKLRFYYHKIIFGREPNPQIIIMTIKFQKYFLGFMVISENTHYHRKLVF